MKIIRESAEHHFLTTLDRLKDNPKGWATQYYAFSKYISHTQIIEKTDEITEYLSQIRQKSSDFVDRLSQEMVMFQQGYIYVFSDQDIVVLAYAEMSDARDQAKQIFKTMAAQIPAHFSDSGLLASELYNYQKLADEKIATAMRLQAYEAMADENKVGSITVRRSRREAPKVMVVEDDRFTATYASNILGKDYDLVMCRSGEEGILDYIEHAPDIVFLDIHLPGLDGHEVLQAIHAIDPKAFVVMLSVDTERKNIQKASETGAQNFLKKPFSKERILGVVKKSPYISGVSSSIH